MGGATISFLNMVKGLQQKGIIPVVVCPDTRINKDFMELLKVNGIEYYYAPVVLSIIPKAQKGHYLHWLKAFLLLPVRKMKFRIELKKIILRVSPDLVHTNVGVVHEGFHIAKAMGIPHIWHLREYQTLDFNWRIYPSYDVFRHQLKKSYVITITDGIKNYFKLERLNNAQTIYNGIYQKRDACYSKEKSNYFLIASRISPEKGVRDAIKAFSRFSYRKDYKLLIAGSGNNQYMESLISMAKELGCFNQIDFLGFQQDVRPLMRRAKALIVASYYEGFGRMTAEAAFCGTLVIGRNTAGTKEIMDVIGGFPFNTTDEITIQMDRVASMTSIEYETMVLKSQNIAVNKYSIESNVDKTYLLYQTILDNQVA